MKKIVFSLLFVLGFISLSFSQQYNVRCIAFYNLENLFDTIVDPDTNLILREDFTPLGAKNWNTKKYYHKLDNMARVISEIGVNVEPKGPAIIGVSEVENRSVLEDLVKRPAIMSRNYQIVHFDSPDERGIDVGLLYRPDAFELEKAWVRHEFSLPDNDKTRDQLIVEGKLDGEHMYFMVDHWPSRGGGQQKSAPSRNTVAKNDRAVIDSILGVHPDAKIIFMGDLNDDPVDESVTDYLKANGKIKKLKDGELYNPYYKKFKKGDGSLAYNDAWNLFDQMIMTQALLGSDYQSYKFKSAHIFKKDYMFQQDGRFKGYPLRSFVGNNFKGGFSDHFPVYLYLIREPQ